MEIVSGIRFLHYIALTLHSLMIFTRSKCSGDSMQHWCSGCDDFWYGIVPRLDHVTKQLTSTVHLPVRSIPYPFLSAYLLEIDQSEI